MSAHSEVMDHLQHLAVQIGPRLVGSGEAKTAAQYIAAVFQSAGLEVKTQPYPCPDWKSELARLELDGRMLPAVANTFSQPCDLTAPFIGLGSIEELAAADLQGKIALLYGQLTAEDLSPRSCTVYNPPQHQQIMQLLEEKAPVAVLTTRLVTGSTTPIIKDYDFLIPSATLPPESALALLGSSNASLHLRLDCSQSPSTSANVIGSRTGSRPERIVLCAHYDTIWNCPGAYDNASGVAVLLALAQELAGRSLPIGLELIAFSGEELNARGDEVYLASYGLEIIPIFSGEQGQRDNTSLGPILAAINIDGVGHTLGTNTLATFAASDSFQQTVSGVRARFPGVAPVEAWPASNHYTFYSYAVPTLAVSSMGIRSLMHLPTDTLEWMSRQKLEEVIALVLALVEAIAA
jgi:aminopeptidase YwaD